MISKSGIKYTSAMAVLAMALVAPASAGLKQLEIKGKSQVGGHMVSYGTGASKDLLQGGGSDSVLTMDVDLDFKMKFSQDVSARIDLEVDNATAGNSNAGTGNRFDLGVDQAFFKMNDFLFKNFALSIGKQNLNVSLRDNNSFSWGYGDPVAMVGNYSTRDMDIKAYFAKYNDDSTLKAASTSTSLLTNDADSDLLGVYGEYWLNDDSLVIGYLNYKSESATQTNIVHYGLGLDYFIGESLEVYGEIAGQSIDSTSAIDGSAFQLTLGGEYAFADFDMKPTLNLEYYMQSGKDTSGSGAWQNVGGSKAAADNQSLFVEGAGSVRDVAFSNGIVSHGSSNGTLANGYNVIRLNGWISPSKATKVGLGIHLFDSEDTGAGDLGTEFDLTASWKYSQDVSFGAGAFMWTGGESKGSTTAWAASPATEWEDVTGFSFTSKLAF